jgi:hypothetical protein
MSESIRNEQKASSIRFGDARVFGEDSDVRRKLTDSDAIVRFEELWSGTLSAHVESAPEITRDEAEEMLEQKLKSFAVMGYKYRQFSLHQVPFIARITGGGSCDQLWALGAHRDNTRLCVHFDTIAERDRFEQIAKELGWSSKVLGVRLLTDFMEKFPIEKRSRSGNSESHD